MNVTFPIVGTYLLTFRIVNKGLAQAVATILIAVRSDEPVQLVNVIQYPCNPFAASALRRGVRNVSI
jgi:hypothetical protein